MLDQIELWIEAVMSHALIYPVLGLFTILDALCPLIPAESLLTLAGAWSGSQGVPNVWWVAFSGWIAAMIGDNLCYLLGKRLVWVTRGFSPKSRFGKALNWVEDSVEDRAAFTIIVARFIPWARWVLTIVLGSRRYCWRRFVVLDSIGAFIWAYQAAWIGYLGGRAVQDYPLLGLVLGITLGSLVGVAVERIRRSVAESRAVHTATSSARNRPPDRTVR